MVVVVDDVGEVDAAEDWLLSSCASFASAALRVDSAEDTDSLSAVVSSVPSDCPALTFSPAATVTVATLPPT